MYLTEICDVFSGFAFKSFNSDKNGKPVIKIGNINADGSMDIEECSYSTEIVNDKFVSKSNDIYIALSGATTGKVALMNYDGFYINQRVGIVRLKNKDIPISYLYYYLSSKTKKILEDAAGAAQPNISPKQIANYLFINRTVFEMESISNELNSLNNAIKTKKSQLLSLDELVKSRFIEMFGKYFEDKSRLVKVSTLASATIGLTYKPENVSENGTIVLRSGNIQNAELYLEKDIVRVSNVKIKEDKYVRENDILMCSRNGSAKLVGKCCRIPKLDEPMTYGAFMTVIRSIYPYFLNGFFNSTYFTQQLTGTQTASVNQITTGMLNNYDVICPTKDEENEFAKFVKLIDKSKFVCQFIQGTFYAKYARFRPPP